MNKLMYAAVALCGMLVLGSCEKYETYSDMKKKERDAINWFIAQQNINVISETTFNSQQQTTDTARNEFVLLDRSGVYMQIVRKGCGEKLEENKTVNLLCRFMEKNIQLDSITVRNDRPTWVNQSSAGRQIDTSQYLDKMSVKRTGTTITASFVSGMMYSYYSTASVPAGWLVPLNYVSVGRPENAGDQTAKVRLIVPHSQGTAMASSSVYPCYYEITYERE